MSKLDKKSIEYRKQILDIFKCARRGHVGSAFSIMEILRVLYDDILKYDIKKKLWSERDRFILSKGHGCLALYVILADKGFIKREELKTFCELDSILGGHPDANKIPGVEASTGSLGHGLSIGAGIALSAKMDSKKYGTFVLLGDGECDEGTIWEAAMFASKHKLNNLTAIVDYNKMQCFGKVCDVQELEPFAEKWRSFGFDVKEVDGHDIKALRIILSDTPIKGSKPLVIISHTIKGKGIKTLEGNASWHHKSKISDEVIQKLYDELE